MKICFLISQISNANGMERATTTIVNHLLKKGHEVEIITCKGEAKSAFSLDQNVRLYSLHGETIKNPILRKLYCYWKLWCYVKKSAFDVAIAVDIYLYPYLLPLQWAGFCKGIAWEHFQYNIDSMKGASLSRKLAVRWADKVIVLGQRDLETYRHHFPNANNIMYIYNPVSFICTQNKSLSLHRILAAGRLTKQKGFDLLIDAWKQIENRDTQEWTLDIFGEGEEREALEHQIHVNELKRVHLCGYSKDLEREMENSSIFVLSSRYEGFVLVLLEAQAKGLPCVSFNCKEGPAEIIDDGVNGFLAEDGSVEDLADKLYRLICDKDLRIRFSQMAQKDLGRFDPERIAEQWNQMLSAL